MSKMWDEDRENVVECKYGQLSSTEKIENKNKNKTKQTRNNTKQNNMAVQMSRSCKL